MTLMWCNPLETSYNWEYISYTANILTCQTQVGVIRLTLAAFHLGLPVPWLCIVHAGSHGTALQVHRNGTEPVLMWLVTAVISSYAAKNP